MAFCPHCGNGLQGNERFCAQCGKEVAAPAAAPVQSGAPPGAFVPPAAYPAGNAGAGPAVTQAATASGGRRRITTPVVVGFWILVLIGFWFYERSKSGNAPTSTQTMPGAPSGSPTGPWPGNTNPGLLNQQWLNVQWQNQNGTMAITGTWSNNSAFTIASGVVECDQNDSDSILVARNNVTLNGPVAPNATNRYTGVRVGPLSSRTYSVNCKMISVSR